MSKEDAPLPATVPRKRRQIEALLDRHIAIWLAGSEITYGERKLLELEKERRRQQSPAPLQVGLVLDPAGMTPQQIACLPRLLLDATEIHHAGVPSRVHTACRAMGVPVNVHRGDERAVIHASDVLIAFPKENTVQAFASGGVWDKVGAAKRRSLDVRVVMPNGLLQGEQ